MTRLIDGLMPAGEKACIVESTTDPSDVATTHFHQSSLLLTVLELHIGCSGKLFSHK